MSREAALVSLRERWQAMVTDDGAESCWPWGGYINPQTGYGQIALPVALVDEGWPRTATAPSVSCRLHNGPPPEGREFVLHSCHNRSCCNPTHLRWGTQAENMQDRVLAGGQNTRVLTPEDVCAIRSRLDGVVSGRMVLYDKLGSEYGVTADSIRDIARGRSWAWLDCGWQQRCAEDLTAAGGAS